MLKTKKFWTIKIAGVSGVGKTTVLKNIGDNKELRCKIITYSALLKKYRDEELANYALEEILHSSKGLVVMDEHLEFDNPHKTKNYLRENTRGLILLDVPAKILIERIKSDPYKKRACDEEKICADLVLSRKKALEISREINMPLLIVPNLNGNLQLTVKLVINFLKTIQP